MQIQRKLYHYFMTEQGRIDLVMTGMNMPQIAGDSLARKLMKIHQDISIILYIGASSDRIDEDTAREMGVSAYVMKP